MRLLGGFLKAAEKNEGGRPTKTPTGREGVSKPTLPASGISWKLSAEAQKLDAIAMEWRRQFMAEGLAAKVEGGKTAGVSRPKKDVTASTQPISRKPTTRKKMAAEAGVSERKIQQAISPANDPRLQHKFRAGRLQWPAKG